MPTSSQAMIRNRGNSPKLQMSYQSIPPVGFASWNGAAKYINDTSNPKKMLTFDTCAPQTLNINGVAGVFSYDSSTKCYRWLIRSMHPPKQSQKKNFQAGDTVWGSDNNFEKIGNLEDSLTFMPEEISDHELTKHFTSPTPSFHDTGMVVPLNKKSGTGTKSRSPTPSSGQTSRCGDTPPRQIKDFRGRRFAYRPDGTLIRVDRYGKEHVVRELPKLGKSISLDSADSKRKQAPKLTVNTMDPTTVCDKPPVPYKRQGFVPKKSAKHAMKKSLLEEVKEKVSWNTRINPGTCCWKGEAPPEKMPTAVCLSLRCQDEFTHWEVKNLIESQVVCTVNTIRYDPVSVRMGDSEVLDRWIIVLATRSERDKAVKSGLVVNCDKIIVRAWDDVMNAEVQAGSFLDTTPYRLPLHGEKNCVALKSFLAAHAEY